MELCNGFILPTTNTYINNVMFMSLRIARVGTYFGMLHNLNSALHAKANDTSIRHGQQTARLIENIYPYYAPSGNPFLLEIQRFYGVIYSVTLCRKSLFISFINISSSLFICAKNNHCKLF